MDDSHADADADQDKDEAADAGSDGSLSGKEKERWEEEVQVRFIRSVHELDLLGFVRHTTRRGEHVLKTVFEPAEDVC